MPQRVQRATIGCIRPIGRTVEAQAKPILSNGDAFTVALPEQRQRIA
ncbi:MAG: hypothetical protein JOZ61_01425 [Verrucomicrobia bacterium]|nr:hypothetical protein [Verrucomicrobiota bacterium]